MARFARRVRHELDGVHRAPRPGRGVQFIHHVHREQLVRHGEVESGKIHRPRALDGGAKIFGVHFKGEIAPVQAQRGECGIVHRRRCRMADGRTQHRAQSRGGVDGG